MDGIRPEVPEKNLLLLPGWSVLSFAFRVYGDW